MKTVPTGLSKNYQRVVIAVKAEKQEHQEISQKLSTAIQNRLNQSKVLGPASTGTPTKDALKMMVTVTEKTDASRAMRMMNVGGEAEIVCRVDLIDPKTQAMVGSFNVTGNSTRQVQTEIGGANTSWFDNFDGRAMLAMAEEIDEFLSERK